jgi:hypothetical protein
MGLSLVTVRDQNTLREFIRFPWSVYQNDPYWVPPLIREEKKLFNPACHPFYQHARVELYLVQDERHHLLGRIAAIVNQNHIKFHQEQAGFFGFFESVNSVEVAQVLLKAVREFLQAQGMELMRGPMSFSTNEQCGLLIEGFNSSPVFMMPYNPGYYPELIEACGLTKAKDLYAYEADRSIQVPEKMLRVAERIKAKEEIVVRNLVMKNFAQEVNIIKEVYNKAWSYNWGFIPMTDEEFSHMAQELKQVVIPDFVFIAEVKGQPAGFSLSLPDYNYALKHLNGRLFPFGLAKLLWYSRRIKTLRLITLGVIKEYQKRGIDTIFYLETIKKGLEKGYQKAELSWVLEDNDLMNRAILSLGGRLYKKYRIYETKF